MTNLGFNIEKAEEVAAVAEEATANTEAENDVPSLQVSPEVVPEKRPEPRYHTQIVLKTIGKPIERAKTPAELFIAVAHAMLGQSCNSAPNLV